jgi:hypothetical protein
VERSDTTHVCEVRVQGNTSRTGYEHGGCYGGGMSVTTGPHHLRRGRGMSRQGTEAMRGAHMSHAPQHNQAQGTSRAARDALGPPHERALVPGGASAGQRIGCAVSTAEHTPRPEDLRRRCEDAMPGSTYTGSW